MRQKQKGRTWSVILVMIITGILFYVMNVYTPLFADDYDYSFSFFTGARISSLLDIPASQYVHYFIINGRFVTHTLAQTFLYLGKDIFNIINVFAFLLLGILICYHATGSVNKLNASALLVTYCLLFLITPAFGQSFLWVDGSATYLYGVILALLYLVPYRRALEVSESVSGAGKLIIKFVLMFFSGILAGNAFENMGSALIIIIAAYLICYKLNSVKIHAWMLGLGNFLGLMLSVLAPGTQSRLNVAGGISIKGIFRSAIFIAADFVEYLWLPLAMILVIAWISCSGAPKENRLVDRITSLVAKIPCACIYLLGALAAAFAMILSPQFPERAWSAPVVLIVIALVAIGSELKSAFNSKLWVPVVSAVVVCVSCATWFNAYFELKSTYYSHLDRVTKIEMAVDSGEDTVSIPAITSTSRYSVFSIGGDLEWDPEVWPNSSMAHYFEIGEIARQQGDVHN